MGPRQRLGGREEMRRCYKEVGEGGREGGTVTGTPTADDEVDDSALLPVDGGLSYTTNSPNLAAF